VASQAIMFISLNVICIKDETLVAVGDLGGNASIYDI